MDGTNTQTTQTTPTAPAAQPQQTPPAVQQTAAAQSNQNQVPDFDYEKLAGIISGKQSVTEDTVLKNYFKQQGLTKEQADAAIAEYKRQQAANQPDVTALQQQATESQRIAQQAVLEREATLAAVSLGIDVKTIPYVLKLADLSGVTGADGKVNQESMNNALNKVLEAVPGLKTQATTTTGFQQIGAAQQQPTVQQPAAPTAAVATKRWNRFNN